MIDQVLRVTVPHLDRFGIPYLISGGIATTMHGRPRLTQSIDLVIAPAREQLDRLIEALDPDFALSRNAAEDAYAPGGVQCDSPNPGVQGGFLVLHGRCIRRDHAWAGRSNSKSFRA